MSAPLWLFASAFAGLAVAAPAAARPLDQVRESGTIELCANPNALPFSAKQGERRGFQIEMGDALAKQLGVALQIGWVVTQFDASRTDCDLVLDAIAIPEAQGETRLKLSKSYRRSGIVLAVRADNPALHALGDIDRAAKVGVMPGSMAAMWLGKRGVHTSPNVFEDGLLDEVASGEVVAAAVTPTSIGFYNSAHPDRPMRLVDAFAREPDLAWNVAVGMVKPDPALTDAVNAALDRLLADGTIRRIYASYGVELLPPR
jgi:ABC-type amino acid transport substrate-binding protein